MSPAAPPPAALRGARVRVPGSSSNLGAGFDCLGIALNRYLTAEFAPARDGRQAGTRVDRRGTLRPLDDGPDGHDLFLRAFERMLHTLGAPPAAGVLTLDSEIPIGRGLGSSAAAVVGGIVLAAAAAGHALDRAAALRTAREFEEHLDNVAPSLLGGLVAVASEDGGTPHAFRLPLSDAVGFAFAAPGVELETRRARSVLPRTVPHGDAVHNLGALAALTQGFASGDASLLRLGFSDRLHVRYRVPLIPGAAAALEAARQSGAWGATVSGAGSGLIAVADPARALAVADAMAVAFRRAAGPAGVVSFAAQPDTAGATIG